MSFDRLPLSLQMIARFVRATFGRSEQGASMVEYALLLALIAVVCIAAVGIVGGNANNKFTSIGNSLS